MTYRGHVKNGVVVLDEAINLPEGAHVEVCLPDQVAKADTDEEVPTLYERLEPFIGKAEGLPSDMSINHDHYLYGVPEHK
jgi:hypothetical protein